jgi:2-isopropylmalate synthase
MNPELVGNRAGCWSPTWPAKATSSTRPANWAWIWGATATTAAKDRRPIKELEQEGYQFDVADGSFKILVEKFTEQFDPLFDLESFRVTIEKTRTALHGPRHHQDRVGGSRKSPPPRADGPVSALDNALRKALDQFYPDLDSHAPGGLQGARHRRPRGHRRPVRVLIESRDQDEIWSTIGVSEDIIEASWQALADSFQYKLAKAQKARRADNRPFARPK